MRKKFPQIGICIQVRVYRAWILLVATVGALVPAVASATIGPGSLPVAATSPTAGSQYQTIYPTRILDTRIGLGAPAGKLEPNATISVQVAGTAGLPSTGIAAVLFNLTVTDTTAAGWVAVFPDLTAHNGTSSVNFSAGATRAAMVEVPLGTNGAVRILNSGGSSSVILDLAGFFQVGGPKGAGLFRALTPARLMDTRSGIGGSTRLGPLQTVVLQVAGKGNVPSVGAAAVALNLTAVSPTSPTFIRVVPAGNQAAISSINLGAGEVVANKAVAQLSPTGQVSLYNSAGTVDLVVDVTGWFTDGSDAAATGGMFNSIAPTRILDTRTGLGGTSGLVSGQHTITAQVSGVASLPPTGVGALLANVTETLNGPSPGFLTAFQSGSTLPLASDLNWAAGETAANTSFSRLGPDGKLSLFLAAGTAHLIVDLLGWFGEMPSLGAPPAGPAVPTVTLGADNALHVEWVAPASGGSELVNYTVQMSPPGALNTRPSTVLVADFDSLDCTVAYSFQVAALNAGGAGPWSPPSAAVTPRCPPKPQARRIPVPWRAMTHPLSCESASLQMILAYRGSPVNQDDVMAFVGQDLRSAYWDSTGLRWGDPYQVFVGSVDGSESNYTGYGMKVPPLETAANHFRLPLLRAGEGIPPADLYSALLDGHPAIVWGSYDYVPHPAVRYTAFNGRPVLFGRGFEHVYVVAYVDPQSVGILDPLRSPTMIYMSKAQFEAQWSQFANAGLIFQ